MLDSSESIADSTLGLDTVKIPAKAFVDALMPDATPTETLIGVVEFDDNVVATTLDLTDWDHKADIISRIDAIADQFSTQYTNWEAGLTEATGLLETTPEDRGDTEHPDLIIIFTNGAPTTSDSGSGGISDPSHLAAAILAANAAKTSDDDLPI